MTVSLIIFDLDGVLCDLKEVHRDAFLSAVKTAQGIELSKEWHDRELCGLPTRVKLHKIGIRPDAHPLIFKLKQEQTLVECEKLGQDKELQVLLDRCKEDGRRLACCSNSIRGTVDLVLEKLGVLSCFDLVLGNDDVLATKPSPEMYYKTMAILGVKLSETLIVEDSPVGAEAIKHAGCKGLMVRNRADLTWEKIQSAS